MLWMQGNRLFPASPIEWRGKRNSSRLSSANRASHILSTAHTREVRGMVRPVPASVFDFGTVSSPLTTTPLSQFRRRSIIRNERASDARRPVSSESTSNGNSAGERLLAVASISLRSSSGLMACPISCRSFRHLTLSASDPQRPWAFRICLSTLVSKFAVRADFFERVFFSGVRRYLPRRCHKRGDRRILRSKSRQNVHMLHVYSMRGRYAERANHLPPWRTRASSPAEIPD